MLLIVLPMTLLFGIAILRHDAAGQLRLELPVVTVTSESQLQNCRIVVLEAANEKVSCGTPSTPPDCLLKGM